MKKEKQPKYSNLNYSNWIYNSLEFYFSNRNNYYKNIITFLFDISEEPEELMNQVLNLCKNSLFESELIYLLNQIKSSKPEEPIKPEELDG